MHLEVTQGTLARWQVAMTVMMEVTCCDVGRWKAQASVDVENCDVVMLTVTSNIVTLGKCLEKLVENKVNKEETYLRVKCHKVESQVEGGWRGWCGGVVVEVMEGGVEKGEGRRVYNLLRRRKQDQNSDVTAAPLEQSAPFRAFLSGPFGLMTSQKRR